MTRTTENSKGGATLPASPLLIGFYIASPAFLMPVLILLETYLIPALSQPSSKPPDGPFLSVLISITWIVFISCKLRPRFSWHWFFAWWPILSVLGLMTILALAALTGVPLGREEKFPIILATLPMIGLLLCISLGSLIFYTVSFLFMFGGS